MALCLVRQLRNSWEDVENWSIKELRLDCLKSRLCRLCLGAAAYHLWRHRNDILHGNSLSSEEQIVAKIKWDVRACILSTGSYKKSLENMQLASLWNLPRIVH
jgi:superfamily II helicase